MTTPLRDVRSNDWSERIAAADAVVVLLHGYGSNERDLTGIVPPLGLSAPWASLRAPLDPGNGGAAWFAIVTPGDPDPDPLAAATDAIWAWVDANVPPATRIAPIGFSQGGLMASQLLRTRPERVVAPVILGGFVQRSAQPGDSLLEADRPAVFWGRGSEDRVIGQPAVSRTAEFLGTHSSLEEHVYPGLAHGIHAQELTDVRAFLARHADSVLADA